MTAVDIEIRRTAPDELRTVATAARIALLAAPPVDDDEWTKVDLRRWETLRSFSAWEPSREPDAAPSCVGHVASFDTTTTVPGGAAVPTIAVTSAGVLPTHVRRGLFTRLMDALHADAVDSGAVLASLRASEATIYARHGYGMAGYALDATIDCARALPLRGAEATGSFELIPPDRVEAVAREIYARASARPGRIERPDWLWQRYLEKAIAATSSEVVVAHRSDDGTLDGYVHYELHFTDDLWGPDHGAGFVHEVWATTPAVEMALWQYVLSVPLARRYKVEELAADTPLFHAANDYRAIRVGMQWDEQWVRLLDVGAALAARTWNDAAPVAIAVRDERRGVNGCWRIGADDARPTTDAPDLVTDVGGISAAYLGSTSWWDLIATGRAEAAEPAAVARADAVFSHRPLAFCGTFF